MEMQSCQQTKLLREAIIRNSYSHYVPQSIDNISELPSALLALVLLCSVVFGRLSSRGKQHHKNNNFTGMFPCSTDINLLKIQNEKMS